MQDLRDYTINNYSFLLPFNMRQSISGVDFADMILKYSDHEKAKECAKFAKIWIKEIKRWRGSTKVLVYMYEYMLERD